MYIHNNVTKRHLIFSYNQNIISSLRGWTTKIFVAYFSILYCAQEIRKRKLETKKIRGIFMYQIIIKWLIHPTPSGSASTFLNSAITGRTISIGFMNIRIYR
jgi:hypothetical protein